MPKEGVGFMHRTLAQFVRVMQRTVAQDRSSRGRMVPGRE